MIAASLGDIAGVVFVIVFGLIVLATLTDTYLESYTYQRRRKDRIRQANLVRTAGQGLVACPECGNPVDPMADPTPEVTAAYEAVVRAVGKEPDTRRNNRMAGPGITLVRVRGEADGWGWGPGWAKRSTCRLWGPGLSEPD